MAINRNCINVMIFPAPGSSLKNVLKETCNQIFAYAKTKAQISFAVTAKLISAFVFATGIVQFLFFLNPIWLLAIFYTWSETPKTGFLASWLI